MLALGRAGALPLLIARCAAGDGDAKRKLKANRPVREDWRQKSKPIPSGAVYPAKDHCSRCGLCDSYYVAHVKNACAFLGDGMSRVEDLEPVVHGRGRKESMDEMYFGVYDQLLYARKIQPVQGAQWTGIVTTIAVEMLKANMVDAVVCVQSDPDDRLAPRPILARTPEEVIAAKGVKPTLSPNLNTLALVEGSSDIDQLGKIFAAFGTPKSSQWPDMVYLPDYVEYQYVAAPPLRSLFPMASDDALDLLSKMFAYDPKTRITAQQALDHRYFTSTPAPTKPSHLPRPAPKGDSGNNKIPDLNLQGGPVVLSPPRKLRRVIAHEGMDGNIQRPDKVEEHPSGPRHIGDMSSQSSRMPMSVDVGALFGTRPAPRPTLNSADKSHLKRKLDLDPEFGYGE